MNISIISYDPKPFNDNFNLFYITGLLLLSIPCCCCFCFCKILINRYLLFYGNFTDISLYNSNNLGYIIQGLFGYTATPRLTNIIIISCEEITDKSINLMTSNRIIANG